MAIPVKPFLFITCLISWISISSCNDDVTLCESSTSTVMGIGFYELVDGQPLDTALPAITIYAIGKSENLFMDSSLSSVKLPLNPNADTSSFYIQSDSTSMADTITITYTRQLRLISPACGFVTFFNIDTLFGTRHSIDSIYLEDKIINTSNVENLQIYY